MAYTVGSASVEIVPDFRGAQLAITAFFNKQANELKIPVKPVFDDTSKIEQQAARVGSRVSKAMSDAINRDQAAADKLALQMAQGREQAKLDAHEAALKINAAMDKAALKEKLNNEKLADQIYEARLKARNDAHEAALQINAQMDREAARVSKAIADKAAKDRIEAEKLVSRTLKQIEADRIRAEREAEREAARTRQQAQREEVNFARRSARAINEAIRQGLADRRAKIQVEVDRRKAIDAGRETGGIVSRAIEHEIHQNAGLIAAAVGGVLIAGAPLALAGASALFVGIGAVAAAQSERVKSAWVGTWDEISSGAQADAAVLVPVFERMATAIGASFQRMRPLLREAFTEVGPQIDSFVNSLTNAAELALPGLVAAVREGGPVIDGLGDLMEDIGRSTGEFFEILSTHAPAAGGAFSALGDTIGELLPILAELLGQGAETATVVLPALTTALSGVHSALSLVGDVLPTLLTGFLAFRLIQGTGRFLSNFAANMSLAALNGGAFSTVQGRLADGASKLSKAMPALGGAIALVGIVFAESERQISDWTQALKAGGDTAAQARTEMREFDSQVKFLEEAFGGLVAAGTPVGGLLTLIADDTEEVNKAFEEWLASLTPLEAAQRNVDIATRDLASAMGDADVSARDLAHKKGVLRAAAAELARQEAALQREIAGVTEAMAEQADQARSLVDSAFAHDKALLDLEDAQRSYNEAVSEFGAGSFEARSALLELNESMQSVVTTAGQEAWDALPASMSDTQKGILAAKAELDALDQLIADGWNIPPEMQQYRDQLLQITGQANGAALQQAQLAEAVGQLGFQVESLPDSRTIEITAPTDDLKQRLIDLGFTVTEMPDGEIQVEAQTEEALGNLGVLAGELADLDTAHPEPDVGLNDDAFMQAMGQLESDLGTLADTNAEPSVSLNNNSFRTTWGVTSDLIGDLHNRRPTPVAQLNGVPLLNGVGAAIARTTELGRQRPTPVASVVDRATPTISSVLGLLGQMRDKTVTLTTVHREIRETVLSGIPLFNGASGGAITPSGIIPEYRYDSGGAVVGRGGPWDDLVPFRGPNPGASYRAANGEHILDGRDVALMGGQAGVYAFREMLNSGKLGGPPVSDTLRRMVASGAAPVASGGSTRDVKIYTMDNPRAIIRAMRDEQHQHDTLALPVAWGG